MILRQFLHTEPTIAASYLFGCAGHQAGAVVDPIEPPDFYMKAAEEKGLRIRYVIDTHVHADHLSTGHALAKVPMPSTCCTLMPAPLLVIDRLVMAMFWR